MLHLRPHKIHATRRHPATILVTSSAATAWLGSLDHTKSAKVEH
jgi:hypothetical protein